MLGEQGTCKACGFIFKNLRKRAIFRHYRSMHGYWNIYLLYCISILAEEFVKCHTSQFAQLICTKILYFFTLLVLYFVQLNTCNFCTSIVRMYSISIRMFKCVFPMLSESPDKLSFHVILVTNLFAMLWNDRQLCINDIRIWLWIVFVIHEMYFLIVLKEIFNTTSNRFSWMKNHFLLTNSSS